LIWRVEKVAGRDDRWTEIKFVEDLEKKYGRILGLGEEQLKMQMEGIH
jgi:hypothetical protein